MARNAILQRGKKGSDPAQAEWAPDVWLPFPNVPSPWAQVGKGAVWLSQFPAYYNQPQLHSGREWGSSRYYTPARSVLPDFQMTQRPTNIAGGQRTGQSYTGPVGPLSARKLFARVTQSQVAQSGTSALSWASQLTGSD